MGRSGAKGDVDTSEIREQGGFFRRHTRPSAAASLSTGESELEAIADMRIFKTVFATPSVPPVHQFPFSAVVLADPTIYS
jgi:hypothetical protein